MRPPGIIIMVLFLLLAVLASNAHAEPVAEGHINTGVCGFRDAKDTYYADPKKCPGLCCEDCGVGCYTPMVPYSVLATDAPEKPVLIIVDAGEVK